MPFTYRVPVPPSLIEKLKAGDSLELVRWLVEERMMVAAGTALALIQSPAGVYRVLANGPGFFSKKLIKEGEKLRASDAIGVISANGEDIPYGKPYALAELLE